jgi:serine/threonine protein kinase
MSQGLTPSQALGGRSTQWEPPDPVELQQQIPQYKVLELLGRGGMGAVYKGWQVSLERYVAIKILPPNIEDGDAHFADRFKQEAKTMAKLMHPGIVAVIDAGETSTGLLYFVMEFVEGTDVAQMVKRKGHLDPTSALAISEHVCDALQYAHAHGVIHRDIKPANIMVNAEGQVKVADFGLAKAAGTANLGLTRTDMSMGTPDFISPEALMLGVVTDHRTDLYAVGVMLYNMLTGEIPRGRFKPASQRCGCDPRFDAIIDRAMEQDRDARYQSAQEMRHDLDVILRTPVEQAQAPSQESFAPQAPSKPTASKPQPPRAAKTSQAQAASGTPALPAKKSRAGMMTGVFAGVAVLAVGAFFALKKPAPEARASEASESSKVEPYVFGADSRSPADFPKGVWIPVKFPEDKTGNLYAVNPDGGIKMKAKGGFTFCTLSLRNVALRMKMLRSEQTGDSLLLVRIQGPGARQLILRKGNVAGLRHSQGNRITETKTVTVPSRQPVLTEIAAIEDTTYGAVNGTKLPALRLDNDLMAPGKMLVTSPDTELSDVEFMILDDVPREKWPEFARASAAPSASTAPAVSSSPSPQVSAPSGASYPQPAQWTDATPTFRNYQTSGYGKLVAEGEWLRAEESATLDITDRNNRMLHNCILRARFSDRIDLSLRRRFAENDTRYMGEISSGGAHIAKSTAGSAKLNYKPLPAPLGKGTEHEAVFAAVGDQLTLWLDGKQIAIAHDASLSSGTLALSLTKGEGRIKKIEWGELPDDAAPAASSSSNATKGGSVPVAGLDGGAPKFSSFAPGALWRSQEIHTPSKGPYRWFPEKLADGAIRMRFRVLDPKAHVDLMLRGADTDDKSPHYHATLWTHISGGIFAPPSRVVCPLTPPSDLNAGEEHCVEFYAIGDRLSFFLDGKQIASGTDKTLAEGYAAMTGASVDFLSVDMADLGKAGKTGSGTLPTATKNAPFVNTLGMEFVPVPGTKVLFSIWDTRVMDYEKYAAANPNVDGTWKTQQKDNVPVGREPDHPVVGVSWNDAQAFCQWLTEKEAAEGKLPTGAQYRLPTDAEWSTAVGLPPEPGATPEAKNRRNNVDFPWGKEWPPTKKVGNYADESFHAKFPLPKDVPANHPNYQWFVGYDDGFASTSPVGSFPANAFGLYDMGGNVWQWCEDWWNADHKDRVARGSSWHSMGREYMLSSYREHIAPQYRFPNDGFRCVLAPAPSTAPAASNAAPAKQTIDLLTLADPAKDTMKAEGMAGANQWTKTGGTLAFTADAKSGKISAPVSLNGLRDYEIEAVVATSQDNLLTLDFPTSAANQGTLDFRIGSGVELAMDQNHQRQKISPWPEMKGPPWRMAGRVTFDADGVNGVLSATVNGVPAGSWHGPLTKLGKPAENHRDFPGELLPALFVLRGSREYTSWTLRVFDGEAKVLRGAATTGGAKSATKAAP